MIEGKNKKRMAMTLVLALSGITMINLKAGYEKEKNDTIALASEKKAITNAPVKKEYCQPSGTVSTFEWIADVDINTCHNHSKKHDNGYSHYPSSGTATVLTQGTTYKLQLKPGFSFMKYNENFKVWIDCNQDGDFEDAGEMVLADSSKTEVHKQIIVPQKAFEGETKMRVCMSHYPILSPCENINYGEVKDYTIQVLSAQLSGDAKK